MDFGFFPPETSTPSSQSTFLLEDPLQSVFTTSTSSLDLGTIIDDLDRSTIPSNPLTDKLIAYAYQTFVSELWPSELDSIPGAYEVARSWEDVGSISQDSCYANAYLALLAFSLADMNDDTRLAAYARQYQGQALNEVRQRIAQNTAQDLLTLKAILKLFSTESILDNTAAARVHLKMLRNLVISAGGVILLDCWFREDLLSCDSYFALKYGTRPTLPAQDWTPGPLSPPWKARLIAAGAFRDVTTTIDPSIEHQILKTLISDLRELFQGHDYILNHEVPMDEQLLRWRQLRKFDCISRLADHYTNLAIYPHLYERPKTHALATHAIALLMNMTMGCPEPVRFGLKILQDMRTEYQESERESKTEDSARLWLWAAYIGALAEQVHPTIPANGDFFSIAMKGLIRKLEVKNWEQLRKILKQFLLSDKLHAEINGRPAFRKVDFRRGLYSSSGTSWRVPIIPPSSRSPSPLKLQGG
jgi:hypothetical protein